MTICVVHANLRQMSEWTLCIVYQKIVEHRVNIWKKYFCRMLSLDDDCLRPRVVSFLDFKQFTYDFFLLFIKHDFGNLLLCFLWLLFSHTIEWGAGICDKKYDILFIIFIHTFLFNLIYISLFTSLSAPGRYLRRIGENWRIKCMNGLNRSQFINFGVYKFEKLS